MAYPIETGQAGGASSVAAASHTLPIPSGAGNLLLAWVSTNGVNASASGWTLIEPAIFASSGLFLLGRLDPGGLGSTFSVALSADSFASWDVRRISGAAGIPEGEADIDSVATGGSSSSPDPGLVSGGGESIQNLWFSAVGWSGDISHVSFSGGYGLSNHTYRNASGTGVAVCAKNDTTETDNPGPHAISGSADWCAITVVVHPPVSHELSKEVSDGLLLGDSLSRVAAYTRAFSDALSLGDAKSTALAIVRSFSDGLLMSDGSGRVAAYAKAIADAIALGDAKSTVAAIAKAVADNIHLGDSKTLAMVFGKAIADALSLGDSVATAGTLSKMVADAIALGEVRSTVGVVFRSFSDALSLGDAKGAGQIIGQYKEIADALGLGESLATHRTIGKSVSDGLAVGEILYPLRSLVKEVFSSLALGENVGRATGFAKALSDGLALGESFDTSLSGALTKAVSDAVTLGENLATVQAIAKAIADALTIAESVVKSLSGALSKEVSDGLSLGEVISTERAIVFAVSDGLQLMAGSDQQLAATELSKTVADALTIGEKFKARKGGGWFGPDGPCECGCECTCDEAREEYGHGSILVIRNATAAGATYEGANQRASNCLGTAAVTPETWESPGGIDFGFEPVNQLACTTSASVVDIIPFSTSNFAWGGSISPHNPDGTGCAISDAIAGPFGSSAFSNAPLPITLAGVITYSCVDGVYDYRLQVSASYYVINAIFDIADHPDWAWSELPLFAGNPRGVGWSGVKMIDGVEHVFQIAVRGLFANGFDKTWQVSLAATVDDSRTFVTLGTPPYDSFGLLIGSVSIL